MFEFSALAAKAESPRFDAEDLHFGDEMVFCWGSKPRFHDFNILEIGLEGLLEAIAKVVTKVVERVLGVLDHNIVRDFCRIHNDIKGLRDRFNEPATI